MQPTIAICDIQHMQIAEFLPLLTFDRRRTGQQRRAEKYSKYFCPHHTYFYRCYGILRRL